MVYQTPKIPEFIITGIEKENIHLFAELMARLKSNNGVKDSDLITLASEMKHLQRKIQAAYEADVNVPFPGDIFKTLTVLNQALSIFEQLPEPNKAAHKEPQTFGSNYRSTGTFQNQPQTARTGHSGPPPSVQYEVNNHASNSGNELKSGEFSLIDL